MDIQQNSSSVSQMNPQKIHIQNRIGRGSQGAVYNAYNQQTMQRYAIKVINIYIMTEKQQERLKCEIQSNFTLSISNKRKNNEKQKYTYFPYFYGYWINQKHAHLVFQKCQGNALQGINLNRTPACSYSFAYVLLYDVLNALQLLENRNIIHRDLKPQNILVDKGQFKICDLGLSRIAERGKKLTIDVGNIMSRSPQFYSGSYDCKTDVWSLGINVFWLAFGNLPFDQQVKQLIKQKKIIDIIKRISNKQFKVNLGTLQSYLIQILKNMLEIQPQNRLTATQILQAHFRSCQFNKQDIKIQIKYLFYKFLQYRSRDVYTAHLYLILMLLVIDFTKMDCQFKNTNQINKQKGQEGKKQLIRRVKVNIYCILVFILKQQEEHMQNKLKQLFQYYQSNWAKQLQKDQRNTKRMERGIKNCQQALDLHKIKVIAEKFPLVLETVKIYNKTSRDQNNVISLWDLKILDLRKLRI